MSDQKINVLSQYIWPCLVYPLQNAPLSQLPMNYLEDVDKIIRSTVKEIISLPGDTPNSMLYTARKLKGLATFRAKWEAFVQHYGICSALEKANNAYVNITRDISQEKQLCLAKLDVKLADIKSTTFHGRTIVTTAAIRDVLRKKEFTNWCNLQQRGKGVILYQEYTPANRWIHKKDGLSCSEWTDALKLTANVAPVRVLHGRSQDGNHCRHCHSEIETLPHVLGFCKQGFLLRNTRHHTIRSAIATAIAKTGLETYEEVHCLGVDSSNRRVDIIAIDRKKEYGYIIDPTVRFESRVGQAEEINVEKKDIYEATIPYLKMKYNLKDIEVIGLFVGARGTITQFFHEFCKKFKLKNEFMCSIGMMALKGSIYILRNHLYGEKMI